MEHRTQQQEMRFVQALGYAWGRIDEQPMSGVVLAGSMEFANWYSAYDEQEQTLQDSWDYFITLPHDKQVRLSEENKRLPFVR
jgi:hypothetical protein